MKLLTQNSDLKKTGVWAWTLPAHFATLENGEKFYTCPNAGVCGAFCYAKTGTFQFSNVKRAHVEKLMLVLNDLPEFERLMHSELMHKRYKGAFIRVHDAGDYFSKEYAETWARIAEKHTDKTFYSYTKQVELIKGMASSGAFPTNYIFIYSFGGKQDHLIDRQTDRHCDVFGTYSELVDGGYVDIANDDRLAAISENHRIGIFRNNIPHIIKKLGDSSFSTFANDNQKQSDIFARAL